MEREKKPVNNTHEKKKKRKTRKITEDLNNPKYGGREGDYKEFPEDF